MQFAAGQHGLEQIGCVHRSFRRARSHDRMQLIDEEQDLPLCRLHLFEHRLQSFFELAAKLCAGHQRSHVEGDDPLLLQSFRYVSFDDARGEPFDNGGFPDAGFADEHGIVLGSP